MTTTAARSHRPVSAINLTELVEDVAALVRAALPPGVVLDLAVPRETSITVRAHPSSLFQALLAVMTHAREAMPCRGLMRVAVGWDGAGDGPRALVVVQDQGAGLSRASIERLFDAFTARERTRVGIGLSAARSLIEEIGGSIAVHSDVGNGTRFTISIPVR